ncbi:GMP/IMP nucleotidase [Gammaproteobacteria bacterium LSUCC0112]|nr:GMP/IMP nucleotidase [Gammaproteobacteria bacterium LSUCC0112]
MLEWSDIDTVLFDMDGTLLDLHFDNYFWETLVPETWGARVGLTPEQAWQELGQLYQSMHGQLDWYCIDFWTKKLGIDIQQLKEQWRHKIAVRPNVDVFLQGLTNIDKQLFLVTNAHPGSLRLKMEHTRLDQHFHHIVSSHTLGLAKENHGFWQRLQSHQFFDPQHTVLFDDNLHVLRQARAEGIKHLFAIRQPDSQRPPLYSDEFVHIEDFADILPTPQDTKLPV